MSTTQSRAGSNAHTYFFREADALDAAARHVARQKRHCAVWSAGCATGDEAYSLAIVLSTKDCEIIGSDIRSDVLDVASSGRYPLRHLRHTDLEVARNYFVRHGDTAEVDPRIRGNVQFVRHHVVDDAPLKPKKARGWDIIFCRNVLLYYDDEAIVDVLASFASVLAPNGILILGASEWASAATLAKLAKDHQLEAVLEQGIVVYRRAKTKPRVRERRQTLTPQSAPHSPKLPAIETPSELRQRADSLMDHGNPKDALALFNMALRNDALAADLHARTAFCHLELGDASSAEKALRRALFLAPNLWPAALVLGDLLMTEDHEASRRYLLQVWNTVESGKLDPMSAATADVAPFVCAESAALDAVRVRLAWLRAKHG